MIAAGQPCPGTKRPAVATTTPDGALALACGFCHRPAGPELLAKANLLRRHALTDAEAEVIVAEATKVARVVRSALRHLDLAGAYLDELGGTRAPGELAEARFQARRAPSHDRPPPRPPRHPHRRQLG